MSGHKPFIHIFIHPPISMSILLADGEQVIRKYRCVTADYGSSDRTLDSVVSIGRKPDTDGVVVVTNRRVIYYAEGKNASKGSDAPPMHLQEAFIDKVCSTEFVKVTTKTAMMVPIALMIIGLIPILMGLANKNNLMYIIPGAVILATGAVFLILSMMSKHDLVLMRVNTTASECGIRVSGVSDNEERSMAFYMVPTNEFKTMASEIGALIIDLQTQGDECIEKWTSSE